MIIQILQHTTVSCYLSKRYDGLATDDSLVTFHNIVTTERMKKPRVNPFPMSRVILFSTFDKGLRLVRNKPRH